MQFETTKYTNYTKAAERRSLPRRLVSTNPAMREKAEASERRLVRPGVLPINIQHSTFNIELPIVAFEPFIGCWAFNVGCSMFSRCFVPGRRPALQENEIKRSRARRLCPGLTG